MRATFIKTLAALAEKDQNIVLLTGDLGFTVMEGFRDAFPAQFLNAGVAEQNMMGVAAGLAMSGKRVFVYSIVPFCTYRCLEHIRNDICYHNVPVCIVGIGGGYSYGHMGATHHALEDIAVMRSLPNMIVTCPGDPLETGALVRAIAAQTQPSYLRLAKTGEPVLHASPPDLRLGKACALRDGTDLSIIGTGNMLQTALESAELLKNQGIAARVLSMHTIKPIDADAILAAAKETSLIVTVEEHSCIGGLGSAVAEVLLRHHCDVPFLPFAAPDAFADRAGSQTYFRNMAGLFPGNITAKVQQFLHAHRRASRQRWGASSGRSL